MSIEILPDLDLGEPSEQLLEWAKNNIREDPEKKCQLISDLRDMIYERGECTPHRTDDAFLLRFLRARHFYLKHAYNLFVNYYNFKEENPHFVEGVNLEYLLRMGEHNIISVPPYREATGRRIIIYRAGQWNPEIFTTDEMFQGTLAILEVSLLEQRAQILGGIAIFDFSGLTINQARYCTPSTAWKVFQLMVTSMPMKVHALHILHESYIVDVMFNLFKPFLNNMMKERMFFHGDNMESLHKHIDPKYLPERYGGVHPDYNYNDWIDNLRKNEIIINELKSLGYKEFTKEETEAMKLAGR